MLDRIAKVTIEDLQRVGPEYMGRLFEVPLVNTAIVCNPNKVEDVSSELINRFSPLHVNSTNISFIFAEQLLSFIVFLSTSKSSKTLRHLSWPNLESVMKSCTSIPDKKHPTATSFTFLFKPLRIIHFLNILSGVFLVSSQVKFKFMFG